MVENGTSLCGGRVNEVSVLLQSLSKGAEGDGFKLPQHSGQKQSMLSVFAAKPSNTNMTIEQNEKLKIRAKNCLFVSITRHTDGSIFLTAAFKVPERTDTISALIIK